MVVPWQYFVLDLITTKAHIVIFGKNKYCQTKTATRNVFKSIIFKMNLTGFVNYWYHKLKAYGRFGLNERDVYPAY